MEKNILYITNYYLEDVVQERKSQRLISQAGQNKSKYIIDVLEKSGNNVTVLSNAWAIDGKFHKSFQSNIDGRVIYSGILGIPIITVISCYLSGRRILRRLERKRKIDAIVFYNMRLENSLLVMYAKRKYSTKLVLQFEDGMSLDNNINPIKRFIYRKLEKRILKKIDAAFLVNSKIKVECPSLVIRGAIRNSSTGIFFGKQQEVPKILFASTLDEQRGSKVLLESLDYIKTPFELIITGKGECADLFVNCKDPRVKFRGFLSYNEYTEELEKSDICINAQLTKKEFGNFSFPSKIYEYISARKIVVSSDVADAESAVGDVAFIYHNDSPINLAKALEQAIDMLHNKEEYTELNKKIDKFIDENSLKNVSKKVDDFLEMVINNR